MKIVFLVIGATFLAVLSIFMIVSLALSVNKNVGPNQFGIVSHRFNMKIYDEVLQPGRHNIPLGAEIDIYSSAIRTISESYVPFSFDKMEIRIDVGVQYRYDVNRMVEMLKLFKSEQVLIKFFYNLVRSSIYSSTVKNFASVMYTNRSDVEELMFADLLKNVNESEIGIIVENFQLRNIDFPPPFDVVIEQKQSQSQAIQTELNSRANQIVVANTSLNNAIERARQTAIQANNTARLTILRANGTALTILTEWSQRAIAYNGIATSLNLSDEELANYIESELLRTADHPVVNIPN